MFVVSVNLNIAVRQLDVENTLSISGHTNSNAEIWKIQIKSKILKRKIPSIFDEFHLIAIASKQLLHQPFSSFRMIFLGVIDFREKFQCESSILILEF